MKFTKYNYELNQIDLPESIRGSPELSEGSAEEPEEQPTSKVGHQEKALWLQRTLGKFG
jgi:hypothetical protein